MKRFKTLVLVWLAVGILTSGWVRGMVGGTAVQHRVHTHSAEKFPQMGTGVSFRPNQNTVENRAESIFEPVMSYLKDDPTEAESEKLTPQHKIDILSKGMAEHPVLGELGGAGKGIAFKLKKAKDLINDPLAQEFFSSEEGRALLHDPAWTDYINAHAGEPLGIALARFRATYPQDFVSTTAQPTPGHLLPAQTDPFHGGGSSAPAAPKQSSSTENFGNTLWKATANPLQGNPFASPGHAHASFHVQGGQPSFHSERHSNGFVAAQQRQESEHGNEDKEDTERMAADQVIVARPVHSSVTTTPAHPDQAVANHVGLQPVDEEHPDHVPAPQLPPEKEGEKKIPQALGVSGTGGGRDNDEDDKKGATGVGPAGHATGVAEGEGEESRSHQMLVQGSVSGLEAAMHDAQRRKTTATAAAGGAGGGGGGNPPGGNNNGPYVDPAILAAKKTAKLSNLNASMMGGMGGGSAEPGEPNSDDEAGKGGEENNEGADDKPDAPDSSNAAVLAEAKAEEKAEAAEAGADEASQSESAQGETLEAFLKRLIAFLQQYPDTVVAKLKTIDFDTQVIDLSQPFDVLNDGSQVVPLGLIYSFESPGFGGDPTRPFKQLTAQLVPQSIQIQNETITFDRDFLEKNLSGEYAEILTSALELEARHVFLFKMIHLCLAWSARMEQAQKGLAGIKDASQAQQAMAASKIDSNDYLAFNLSMLLERFTRTLDAKMSAKMQKAVLAQGPEEIFMDMPMVFGELLGKIEMPLSQSLAQFYQDCLKTPFAQSPMVIAVGKMRSIKGYNERTAFLAQTILPLITEKLSKTEWGVLLTGLRLHLTDYNKGFVQTDPAVFVQKDCDLRLKALAPVLKEVIAALAGAKVPFDYSDLSDFLNNIDAIDQGVVDQNGNPAPELDLPTLQAPGDESVVVMVGLRTYIPAMYVNFMQCVVNQKFAGGHEFGESGNFYEDEGYLHLDYALDPTQTFQALIALVLRAVQDLKDAESQANDAKKDDTQKTSGQSLQGEAAAFVLGTLPRIAFRSGKAVLVASIQELLSLLPQESSDELLAIAQILNTWASPADQAANAALDKSVSDANSDHDAQLVDDDDLALLKSVEADAGG